MAISSQKLPSASELDQDCLKIAQYLVDQLLPYLFKKQRGRKRAEQMPDVLHHRLSLLLTNFVLYWLFLQFWPEKVKISFFDLLTMRQKSGAWNLFIAACGQTSNTRSKQWDHLGRVISQKTNSNTWHGPALLEIRGALTRTLIS